jgi:glucose-6-phosphate 1-dehydrogenase
VIQPVNPLRDPQDRRLPRIAGPCSLVLFGVTGDLSRKKLMPAVYDLANRGLLPPGFALVGFARREWANQDFAEVVHEAVKTHARTPFREEVWKQLSEGFRFVSGDFADDAAFAHLRETVDELDEARGTSGNHAFYLSIPPGFFPDVVGQLKEHGLADGGGGSWRRVVIEKPFGHDLASARQLNSVVSDVFPSESVFRIDHYLGKETVQNILAFRFANAMFEPVWNSNYVDHIQITMAEDIGIAGRAGYYDGIGAARDVIQNHLLQLMALIAMEDPSSFDARSLRREKQKVLSSVRIPDDLDKHTARGQYAAGWQGGQKVIGYLDEKDMPPKTTTETYAAIGWTWRTGAGRACRSTCAPASGWDGA